MASRIIEQLKTGGKVVRGWLGVGIQPLTPQLAEKFGVPDGKGAWCDNVVVERLWRTIKYEEIYLRAYRSVSEARRGLARYLAFYNRCRPHSSLGGQTPDQVYFNQPTPIQAAA